VTDDELRDIARKATGTGYYSGGVKALRAVYEAGRREQQGRDAEVRRVALLEAAQIAESRRQMPGGAGTDGSVYMYEQDVYPHEGRRIARAIREEADRG
jgi:hypothetical protein